MKTSARLHTTAIAAVAALIAAAMLTGCAVGPHFKPQTSEAPADFAAWHGGSPELADAERTAPAASAAPQDWSMFNDPVLDALQARALEANHDLRTAALHFAQSRAQRGIVESQKGIQVNASAGVSRLRLSESGETSRLIGAINPANSAQLLQILSEPHNFYQAGFDASWELDLWGRVSRSIESADAGMAASQAMLAQVQLSVQAEVARHYFELRSVQRQIRLAREDIAAAEETLGLVKARADGGLTTDLDVERQNAQAADLRARLPQLLAQEAQASNQITLLLGERPGALQSQLAPLQGNAAAVATLPDLSLGVPSDMALRRPDIQMAQAQLHAATANVGVAVADLYPRVTIGAKFGLEAVNGDSFSDWGSRTWSIGPSLQLPIFDNGRRRATVELRELQQQEAAVAYQQTVLKAWHEIDDALSAYTAERRRNAQLAVRERSSRDALQLARVRYEHGLTDFLVQLDAERTWLQAQRDYTESSSRLALGLVAVSKALGGARDVGG
ncbi:efflux transporter, outer membrane factor (OMF) lipoprotein, NodT family [Variovorax sp. HW608]|uniref:efflux transporter outer membrane subunit n=1 Tax=Variovorax sp. HW608 TaxID=1034889 RepID=UPI00081FD19E|nr:efflux transporter outer membrane subunit [Variovorax sp. HW608]SCK07192.1 efflux transporter, outer membrane factor (OMF) lipoprotein, NodT family [Variovorax sp. HW608]